MLYFLNITVSMIFLLVLLHDLLSTILGDDDWSKNVYLFNENFWNEKCVEDLKIVYDVVLMAVKKRKDEGSFDRCYTERRHDFSTPTIRI